MITIIIPTYNRLRWLKECFGQLERHVDAGQAEVIVIDDGSTDGTADFLQSFRFSSGLPLRVLRQQRGGPGEARNLGVAQAKGDIVCFIDDDSIIQENWFEELVRTFKKLDKSYAAVKGRVVAYQDTSLPRFMQDYYGSDNWATNNIAFRKSVFLEAGGFDEGFTIAAWEDVDLGYRLERMGYKRFFNDKMILRHPNEETIAALRRKFRVNGIGYFQFCKKWLRIDPKWIIGMWLERLLVLYYLLPGMHRINFLKYIHGLRIRYEILGLLQGIFTFGRFSRITKD